MYGTNITYAEKDKYRIWDGQEENQNQSSAFIFFDDLELCTHDRRQNAADPNPTGNTAENKTLSRCVCVYVYGSLKKNNSNKYTIKKLD